MRIWIFLCQQIHNNSFHTSQIFWLHGDKFAVKDKWTERRAIVNGLACIVLCRD